MSNLNDQLAEKTVSSRRWSSNQIVLISHLNYYTVASALPLPRGIPVPLVLCAVLQTVKPALGLLLLVAASIMYKTPWYAIAVLMQEIRMLFGRSSDENESSSLSVKRVD
ncbi:hypothetical protein HYQ45_013662 [Verticillium longisporum]|uniref:Uncharacterized protein n=1 Tax=Verticillium longisporum TaxID=100787 RepID=A0A8I2Z9Q4_VERLO|nr:hypothetical protein HYQ45_013662 [Verticillium longisporum]